MDTDEEEAMGLGDEMERLGKGVEVVDGMSKSSPRLLADEVDERERVLVRKREDRGNGAKHFENSS